MDQKPSNRLLTMKDLLERSRYTSKSTIYRKIAEGSFPRPVDRPGAYPRWREADIDAWQLGLPPKPPK